MEDQVWRPLWFGIDKNQWASEGTGKLESWTIKNLNVYNGAYRDSQILGKKGDDLENSNGMTGMGWRSSLQSKESRVSDIYFKDFQMEGTVARSLKDASIEVIGTTSNIRVFPYGPTDSVAYV